MECPRCGLINSENALRCDCGYDFESQSVKAAYYKQKLPVTIKSYIAVVIGYNLLVLIVAINSGNALSAAIAIFWSICIYWLFIQLVKKQNWARITLIVLTFPVGLLVGLSKDARLYCLQKKNLG